MWVLALNIGEILRNLGKSWGNTVYWMEDPWGSKGLINKSLEGDMCLGNAR